MRKVTQNTLVHLLGAMAAQRAVTIRYAKPVKGGVEITRRRIEIHAIEVSGAGNVIIRCHDDRSGDFHTFRLDRITHYTLHRSDRLARYAQPTSAAAVGEILEIDPDTETEVMFGFRAWDYTFALTA